MTALILLAILHRMPTFGYRVAGGVLGCKRHPGLVPCERDRQRCFRVRARRRVFPFQELDAPPGGRNRCRLLRGVQRQPLSLARPAMVFDSCIVECI